MNLSELKKMMMMNMNKGLGICHRYLRMKETIHKGWLFVSTPDGMMKKETVCWADVIKCVVMSGLGMTSHPYHRNAIRDSMVRFNPERMYQYSEKAKPKEMLGEGLPNNFIPIVLVAVICSLTSHPYHREIEKMRDSIVRFNPKCTYQYSDSEKAKPKEMLGKDIPNNKD